MQKRILSASEQVAESLREEIVRGRWTNTLPGIHTLSAELGFPRKQVERALLLLEKEGLLLPQGVGRKRRIDESKALVDSNPPTMRICILLNDETDKRVDYLGDLQHGLVMAGHSAYYSDKTLQEMNMKLSRVRRFVDAENADAWIVVSGSGILLQWFASLSVPSFALFGHFEGLHIAAAMPDKIPAYQALVDQLVGLGHQKISLLAREDRRLPLPGRTEVAFLKRLEYHGIPTSTYNLPEWQDGKANFQNMLDMLFRVTPPTALIVQEAFVHSAVYHFLSRRGLRVPEDVSLACSNDDNTFAWCEPSVSHVRWESAPIVRRVVNWADRVSRGREDLRQTLTKAHYIAANTVAPAKN